MANCDYCQGDREGFVTKLPKTKGQGSAYIFDSFWGSVLQIRLPFHKVNEYEINYCPMCGRKLMGKKVQDGKIE